ncbi:sensor histidine kinase [[Phormidium ambiguum] IAM M-71]|uniref:Circadian input-output histidine kinase CikA n=1 Tax=[Phormidium ambiguum] IAM M-71 TaxID=454136 RepID=A0A1U7IG60_9CYAN|nr:sensor histidine kinase [Phormidium ambiguum]OKH35986.1 sensor histidine kinase [Phormidium ambiguum IAM M-71]
MFDASEILTAQLDNILERWKTAVRQDSRIESSADLSETALKDSMPVLLNGMVKALANRGTESYEIIASASLEHGNTRAEEGYNAAEIAWEYQILRRVIFSVLEPQLLQGSPEEIIRTMRTLDAVIDEAISQCYTSYVEQRVKELEQVRSQLIMTNQELTRLLRTSKDSLAYMAHELKTPLTSIIGYSDLFLRQQQQTVDVQATVPNLRNIERVLQSGRLLLRLINDALELSSSEAGKLQLHLTCIDPKQLIKDVVATIEPLAQAKNLQLKIDCDRTPNQVTTDIFRLRQIFINLLSNAVRYTNEGFIKIECLTHSNSDWSIMISDTGIGIAQKDLTRIFEPFTRASSNTHYRDEQSTGLGLAIVDRLIKLLHGEIKVVSQLGVGSTFTITFPTEI